MTATLLVATLAVATARVAARRPHPDLARAQVLEEWEPYSEDVDSQVTASGMPDPLDQDASISHRYDKWLETYKRNPNVKVLPWSYTGDPDTWPDMWSTLRPSFGQCDTDTTAGSSSPIDIPVGRAEQQCYGPSYPVVSGPAWSQTPATLNEFVDRSVVFDVQHCSQKCKICEVVCEEVRPPVFLGP